MLAMDVVDTLRHRAELVERELGAEDRDQQLIERLRAIYAAQGIEVSDDVLAAGVQALKEDRFTYNPPRPGLSLTLARIYIDRRRWGLWAVTVLAAIGTIWLAYVLLVSQPRDRLLREIPHELESLQAAIVDTSQVPSAAAEARQLAADGQKALAAGETSAARRVIDELKQLRDRLEQAYDLRIVSQGSTGVWRVPDVNSEARNYYIIVQAIAPDGRALTLPVRSEEDGQVRSVDKWGLRVDEATFQSIADDKRDDGIIQNNHFGVKRWGYLEAEYLMKTTGGAITSW
jgi:hypothetical protein